MRTPPSVTFPAFGFRFGFAERVCTKHLLRLNRRSPEAAALKVASFVETGGTRNFQSIVNAGVRVLRYLNEHSPEEVAGVMPSRFGQVIEVSTLSRSGQISRCTRQTAGCRPTARRTF